MACPFFMPTRRSEEGAWLHPGRLPLGGGWEGHCAAPGHEGVVPAADELREFCNLGYAAGCSRLPQRRVWDAVRFSVVREGESLLTVCYVCELDHRPGEHGTLQYDILRGCWTISHRDPRIQKMVECYLESYLLHKTPPAAAGAIAS